MSWKWRTRREVATLVNLTSHTIRIVPEDGRAIVIEPSGEVARLSCAQFLVGEVEGVPIVETEFGEPVGLPEPREGVIYIASTLLAQEAARLGREDVCSPDTSRNSAVLDEHGALFGVRRLQRFRFK